ncbi:MAG: hypothetical protein ACXWF8_03855 [Methylobacter sp.]
MKTHRSYRKLALCLLTIFPGLAQAAEAPGLEHCCAAWVRASDSELEQLRGGFALPNGINIDFNFSRVSTINGLVVASTFFQLPETVLSQNGAMNLASSLAGSGLSSVIQNGADNQMIRTMTEINIAISHLTNMNLNNNIFSLSNFIPPGAH